MKDRQIWYWAHMLDESKHASYYEVYMQEHPEDKEDKLIESLITEFADCMKKDHIDMAACLVNGEVQYDVLEEQQKKIKHKYYWQRIPAQVYAAIISRMVALSHRAKGQRLSEDDIQFDDVTHLVSRHKIEECLDIICHNTNVLKVNNDFLYAFHLYKYENIFEKNGILPMTRVNKWSRHEETDNYIAVQLYRAWAAYARGTAGEEYVCDSDNAPPDLLKILNSVEYSADDIDLIVTLNKALDVVHFRSDLAAAFIEGGQQTCALVSNLPDKFVI